MLFRDRVDAGGRRRAAYTDGKRWSLRTELGRWKGAPADRARKRT